MCFFKSMPVGNMSEQTEHISIGSFNFLVLLFDISSGVAWRLGPAFGINTFLFNPVVIVVVEKTLLLFDVEASCCCCCCWTGESDVLHRVTSVQLETTKEVGKETGGANVTFPADIEDVGKESDQWGKTFIGTGCCCWLFSWCLLMFWPMDSICWNQFSKIVEIVIFSPHLIY